MPNRQILLERAKWMRSNQTEAERHLWSVLRAKRLARFKFKRQEILGPYIVDFINFEQRVIVEADGSQHAESEYDVRRDGWLNAQGFRVLRFWNSDVLAHTDQVAATIWHAMQATPPLPAAARLSLPRKGGGQ